MSMELAQVIIAALGVIFTSVIAIFTAIFNQNRAKKEDDRLRRDREEKAQKIQFQALSEIKELRVENKFSEKRLDDHEGRIKDLEIYKHRKNGTNG